MIDLKPCPFCGGAVEMYVDGLPENGEVQLQFAQCEQCGALGPTDEDYDFAAHLWNTRPDSLTLTAAVQGEREAIKEIVRGFIGTSDRSSQAVMILSMLNARTSPAVDVLALIREYFRAKDAAKTTHAAMPIEIIESAVDAEADAESALRSLVAASPKAEKKENEQ